MSQSEELDRVKNRIRRLLAKKVENGCTEGEAAAAAEKVGELLAQYNLSMSEIQLHESKCVTKYFYTGKKNRDAQIWTVTAIGAYCDCINWFTKNYDGVAYCFFGLEQDAELAVYLCDVIRKAMNYETKRYKNTDPEYLRANKDPTKSRKSMTDSFQKAMAMRLESRIRSLHKDKDRKVEEHIQIDDCKSTDIVHLKKEKVEAEWKQNGIKLRSAPGVSGPKDASAASAGIAAGDRVNLAKPIEGGKSTKGQLA